MSKVSLQELTDEAMSSPGLGKAWLQVVHAAVKSKVRRMPPRDFGFQEWDEATIEDVVQEVFVRRILNRGGKEYILAEASTTDHAHAGIYRLVSLALDDLREPNVLNNIFENITRRFNEEGVTLGSNDIGDRQSDRTYDEEAAEIGVKRIILSQPRYPNRGTQRESAIFSPVSYSEIVLRLKEEIFPLNAKVVRGGLKRALTHLVRAENYIDDAHDFHEAEAGGLTVEDQASSQPHIWGERVLKQLSQESEKVLVAHLYGVKSDTELARALGLKARQTAAKWHLAMKNELELAFQKEGIVAEDQEQVVLAMCDLLNIKVGDIEESMEA